MGAARADLADLSLAGFLAWEERQELRYERVGGVVRAMAGGTRAHDKIAGNLRFAPGSWPAAAAAKHSARMSRWSARAAT